MICKFCGTENPDSATYCIGCGKRIDGKIICKRCGTENPETAAYCTNCGTRIDGKHVCPSCGAVLDEGAHFCPDCGHVLEKHAEKEKEKKGSLSSRLELSGAICILSAAAVALIFVFCLGITANVSSALSGSSASMHTTMYLYDYFGKTYQTIGESLKTFEAHAECIAYSNYFPAVLGTIISAGALICVPVCVALAGVRFSRYIRGKTEKADYFAPAAAAYAILFCSACALLVLNYGEGSSESLSIHVAMNDATIAGLVIGGVSFLAGCVLLLVAKGKALADRREIVGIVSAAIGTALSVVVLAVTACATIGVSSNDMSLGYDQVKDTLFSYVAMLGRQYYVAFMNDAFAGAYVQAPAETAAVAGISVCAQLAAIALAGVLLVRLWQNATGKGHSSLLAVSIPFFACAVLSFVLTLVFGRLFLDYYAYITLNEAITEEISLFYTVPIVAFVFSALLFALSIVAAVLSKKQSPQEQE